MFTLSTTTRSDRYIIFKSERKRVNARSPQQMLEAIFGRYYLEANLVRRS